MQSVGLNQMDWKSWHRKANYIYGFFLHSSGYRHDGCSNLWRSSYSLCTVIQFFTVLSRHKISMFLKLFFFRYYNENNSILAQNLYIILRCCNERINNNYTHGEYTKLVYSIELLWRSVNSSGVSRCVAELLDPEDEGTISKLSGTL
jgi:hypothetical protein